MGGRVSHLCGSTGRVSENNMGIIDSIFVLHGVINNLLNENKKLYVAFTDFTKAFDYTVRENVWYKRLNYGIRGKLIHEALSGQALKAIFKLRSYVNKFTDFFGFT